MASNTIFSIVEQYFSRNGGILRLKGELAVYFWPRIAGAELAYQVTALRYNDGQLYLQTENPALAHQLTMLSPEIIGRYRKLLGNGVIRGIRVKIGPVQKIKRPVTEEDIEIPLTEPEQQSIRECCQAVADPELASKLAGLMTRHYQNKQIKQREGGKECPSCGVFIAVDLEFCPCCERKLTEEVHEYLNYLRKNHQDISITELQQGLGQVHQMLTARIMQNKKMEE